MSRVKLLDRIRTEDDICLRTACTPIGVSKSERETVSRKLIAVLKRTDKSVGLAAPQIGILKAVAVVKFNGRYWSLYNPVVVRQSRIMKKSNEKCLSFKDRFIVPRPIWAKIAWETIDGEAIEQFFWWKKARVIIHEIDHLNGVCIDLLGKRVSDA